MTCTTCYGTGHVTEYQHRSHNPYGGAVRVHGYCHCGAGAALADRDRDQRDAAFKAHCAAIDYVDRMMGAAMVPLPEEAE